ncbi:MAG: hypothetical protein ABR879_01540 [Methanomassiliicoccales archaeon]
MRPRTLRYASIAGVVLLFVAFFLPFGNLPYQGTESLGSLINDAGIGVKVAALLSRRFQTWALIGGISFVLIAAENDSQVVSADFGVGMVVLIAGIILVTSEIWWKAIIEAFEEDEETDEADLN